jgi:hypothetical protein
MPEICRFLGISLRMYFDDHPPPHFHAVYNEFEAIIRIEDLRMTSGGLPQRVLALVLEWANLHRQELLSNWESLATTGKAQRIDPLV